MTLSDTWLAYMAALHKRAPITPRPIADREEAERATTPWTAEFREFYSLHDGQEQPTGGGDLIGNLFPNFGLLGLDELVANHRYCRSPDNLHDTEDLGDDWAKVARKQPAGEVAHMFVDTYLPFAENGSGALLYVDTRGVSNKVAFATSAGNALMNPVRCRSRWWTMSIRFASVSRRAPNIPACFPPSRMAH